MTDIDASVLVDEQTRGTLAAGDREAPGDPCRDDHRPGVAHRYTDSDIDGITGTVRFDWAALDAGSRRTRGCSCTLEPLPRVDALRSTRTVSVSLDAVELARSSSPVMVFETGLPTRYYFNRTEVRFEHLVRIRHRHLLPVQGSDQRLLVGPLGGPYDPDLAWAYDFPTRQLLPIAGLVSFYNEKTDIEIDGEPLDRPNTHFS